MRSGRGFEALFSVAFATSRNAMATIDQDRRFVAMNDAGLAALGRDRDQVVGRQIDEVVDATDRDAVSRAWRQLAAQGRWTGETRALPYDGAFGPVRYAAALMETERGRIALVVAEGQAAQRDGERDEPLLRLSARERQIVRMLADGKTGAKVAGELHISPLTVQTHVRNAMSKVDAQTRPHLIAIALRGRLV